MNWALIMRTLGLVLLVEAVALLPSLGIALYLNEPDYMAFVITIAIVAATSFCLARTRLDTNDVGYREGFIIATAGWLFLALFGALPFVISGALPGFVDAFF